MNNFDLRKYLAEGRLKVNEGDMDHLMQDLERELKQHDWFYYMSDDPRTYDKGTNERGELKRLLKMLNNSPEAVALYNRYAPVQDGIDLRIKEEKIEEAIKLPKDIEWEFDDVIDQMDAYNATIALTGHSESTGKNYTASAEASRGGEGGDWDWMEVDEVEEETVAEEKRPDYPDVDKDGDTEESMEKALKDRKTSTVTNEGKSAKELETHIAALSKARAQAASSGKTTLLNSLHRDISKAQKELKKLLAKEPTIAVKEEYNVGKGMEKDHDFDAMLDHALKLHAGTPIEDLKKVAHDFTDVNYHREVAYLEDAIDMLEAGKHEEFEDSLKLFKDEVEKTIRSFNESMDDEGRPLEEALNPEVTKAVNRLIKGLAKKYDYSERDAVFAIQAALKQRGYDNVNEDLDLGHQDNEPGMLKGDLYKIGNYAMELYQMMDDLEGIDGEVDLPHWWQSKVTTAKNMISGAKHYLEFELKEPAIDSMVFEAAPEEEDEFHRELDKLVHKTFGHSSDEKKEMKEYMSLEDQAKVYFMQKVKRGEIDELPEDPKAAFLAQMTKDQMDHDRETLDREGGLGEASFYTDDVKSKVVSKLMDQLKK